MKKQRQEKKKYEAGSKTAMTNEKLQNLSHMDFQWRVDATWDQQFVELKKFRDEHGHCRVPRGSGKLGTWVNHQKARRASASKERIIKFKEIGFFDC